MKAVPLTVAARLLNPVAPTKLRVTISQYADTQPLWTWESDTDITSRVLKGQPNIDSELEDVVGAFRTDALVLSLEDADNVVKNLIYTANKYFLIKVEKGFVGAEWITIFDGVIEPYETMEHARNVDTITAYSMETELDYHPGSDSASSGAGPLLATAVGDLWDVSYIPITNRTISVPGPYSWALMALADYTGWTAKEALDNLALVFGCIWKRTERDTAMFVHRNYLGANCTFNLDSNLYDTKFEYRTRRGLDGVHTENTALAIEGYSTGYVDGFNQYINNQLYRAPACKQCYWSAEENWAFQRYNKRIFKIPAFYLLELEPLDRVNLTLRDKAGVLSKTVHTQFTGTEYDGTNKITRVKLEERHTRVYEKYTCNDDDVYVAQGTTWLAQTYTIGTDGYNQVHNIINVRLKMFRTLLPGNMRIYIRATLAGVPVLPNLASVTVNADTYLAVAPAAWYDFTFTVPTTQALATKYAIIVCAPTAAGGNWINWRADTTVANNYSGGNICTNPLSGTDGNWLTVADEDFMFGCWGEIT